MTKRERWREDKVKRKWEGEKKVKEVGLLV